MIAVINRFLITGDTHQNFTRFKNYSKEIQQDEHTAVIILGDAGLNYFLDERDDFVKDYLVNHYYFHIYCVRGNHEARPQDVRDMNLVYDPNVSGYVYQQTRWPQIKYFRDWGIYHINGLRTAVIGGAYSVDKYYRLAKGAKWFENEQLNENERRACCAELTSSPGTYDLVLAHTCPYSWRPTDLFLPSVDQTKVDNTMEYFLDDLMYKIKYKVFLCGHYHDDRILWPRAEMFYTATENLNDIVDRWKYY